MGAILKELHNSASKFQFPSMPKDDVDVKRETAYQEYNILGKGKMSYPSGMGTQIIKWSGYFWGAGRKKLASVNQKWIAPKTCASKLKSWQTKKTPLNLVVSEAGINEDVTIKEKAGKIQTRGYRLPDYLSVNYRLRKGALNQGVLTVGQ